MEKITKHNYEAFYLDYIEGNLSENGQAMLFSFLDNNPKLKTELEFDEDVLDFKLSPEAENLTIYEKENLKHFDCNAGEICLKNVDDFIIADLEGEISTVKKIELDTFINENDLDKRKMAFNATKLKPNLKEVYPNHSDLKKKKGLIIPLFVKITAVAAVVLILFNVLNRQNSVAEIYSPRDINFALSIDSSKQNFDVKTKQNKSLANESNSATSGTFYKPKNKVEKDIEPNITPNRIDDNRFAHIRKKELIKKESKKEGELILPNEIIENQNNDDEIAVVTNKATNASKIKLIDMYKPVTNLTNSYTNLDVSYQKSSPDSDLKVTSFKIGKFSFERKTNK